MVDPPAHISPELAGVGVDGEAFRAAAAVYDAVQAERDAQNDIIAGGTTELASLGDRDRALGRQISASTKVRKQLMVARAKARSVLRTLALSSYMRGDLPENNTDVELETIRAIGAGFAASVSTQRVAELDRLDGSLSLVDDSLARQGAERGTIRQRAAVVNTERHVAIAMAAELNSQLTVHRAVLDQARAQGEVLGTDMTLLALDAYWRAAAEIRRTRPGCGLQWWALAGIGKIESNHGRFRGSRLMGNGDALPRIVGIPLDGSNDTAQIPDTDKGVLDGDTAHDRAVGPMQFIPQTWQRWASDGNHDGIMDPDNVYDAALAAGYYECAGGPMASDEDLTRGYFSYNHSDEYAAAVLSVATFYRNTVVVGSRP